MNRSGQSYGALASWYKDHWTMSKDGLTLIFDGPPEVIVDAEGEPIGVAVMIRAFRGRTELKVDPHRRFINPPLIHEDKLDPVAAFREILFAQLEVAPYAPGWRTKGTVTDFFATPTVDGYFESGDATYSLARAGPADSGPITPLIVGQSLAAGVYYVKQVFMEFDTTSIAGQAREGAVLSLYGWIDWSSTNFVVQARANDWGTFLTTGDFVAGDNLAARTLLATFNSASFTTSGYNVFTSNAAFAANIGKVGAGYTRILLCSENQTNNSAPSSSEQNLGFFSSGETGTTKDPKLTVTHGNPAPVKMAATASMKVLTPQSGSEYVLATMLASVSAPAISATLGIPPLVKMGATASFPNMSETDAAYPLLKMAGSGLLHVPTVAIGVSQTLVKMSATGSSPPVTSVAATVLALQKMAATARAPQVLGPSDYGPVKMAATASMKDVSLLALAFLSAQKMGATARMPGAVAHQDQSIAPERRAKLPAGSANGSGGLETTDDHWDGPGPWDSEDTWDAVEVTLRQAQKLPPGSATVGGRLPGGG